MDRSRLSTQTSCARISSISLGSTKCTLASFLSFPVMHSPTLSDVSSFLQKISFDVSLFLFPELGASPFLLKLTAEPGMCQAQSRRQRHRGECYPAALCSSWDLYTLAAKAPTVTLARNDLCSGLPSLLPGSLGTFSYDFAGIVTSPETPPLLNLVF